MQQIAHREREGARESLRTETSEGLEMQGSSRLVATAPKLSAEDAHECLHQLGVALEVVLPDVLAVEGVATVEVIPGPPQISFGVNSGREEGQGARGVGERGEAGCTCERGKILAADCRRGCRIS